MSSGGGAVHQAAVAGFGSAADAYERGRPDYPDGALEWLLQVTNAGSSSTVIDLGAGTGKLTRVLTPWGSRVLAIEPVEAMRVTLATLVPDAMVVAGTAESIPVRDGVAGAVVVAQAFHWFDAPRALAEIHRVLRAGGHLGLIWNVRDESVPWVRALTEIMEPERAGTPTRRGWPWRPALESSSLFGPLREATFSFEQTMTPARLLDRVVSVSFIAALPPARREQVLNAVRKLMAADPELAGRDSFGLPYRTEVFAAQSLGDTSGGSDARAASAP